MKRFKDKYIGDRAFYKTLFAVALPIIIQNALMNFVSLLDNIMVGQLGTEQMSGVAIVNQLIFIFYLLIFGGLSGVGIYTAQFYGNKDDEGIRQTFRYKFWLGLIVTIAAILIFLWFGDFFINKYLSGTSDGGDLDATLRYGREYLGIILFMLPAVTISQLYISTLRECGQTVVPMVAGIIAVLTNLALDYVLIFGKFGFPELGVAGAAIGTVVARYVELLIAVIWSVCNRNKHTYFKGIFKTLLVPKEKVIKFFVTGTPILINEGLWSFGIALLSQAYSLRGLNVVAGQNISSTINNIFNIIFIAMGDSVAIIVGQYLGSGDMKKAKDFDNKIIATAVISSVIIGSFMFFTAPLYPEIYNTNDMAKLVATHFIMVQAAFMPKDSFLHTSYFTIRAGGKTIVTFLFDSVFMLVFSVPVAYVLSRYTVLGPATIFALVHMVDFIKCIVGYVLLKKNVWMKNIVK